MKEVSAPNSSMTRSVFLWDRMPIYLIFLFLALCYALLATKYRAYQIDTPWVQSFSYNRWNLHIDTDAFMSAHFPVGIETRVFGLVPSFIQALVLNRIGWYPWTGAILSSFFVLLSLAIWNCFLANIGWSRTQRSLYVLALGILEPFVSMATTSRYEFFSFFILSLSLWLASRHYIAAALLLSFLAVETHPFCIVVPLTVLIFLLYQERPVLRTLLLFLLAAMIGAAAYVWMHPLAIITIVHADWHKRTNAVLTPGLFQSYFIDRKRHLPELCFLLWAAVLYWKRRASIANHFPLVACAVVLFISCVLRASVPYMVFLYPFILMAVWNVLQTKRALLIVVAMLMLDILPQYGVLYYYINRNEGYSKEDYASVRRAIDRAQDSMHFSSGEIHIYGDYGLWFSHPQNYVGAATWTEDAIWKSNVVLCYSAPIQSPAMTSLYLIYCPDILRLRSFQDFDTITISGHELHILIHK